MVLPAIAAVAAIQATGALVNAYNAEKARGADRQRLKEMRDLFAKIKPPDYDVSIDAPPEYHQQVLAQPKYSDPQTAPQFDTSKLTPEDLQSVGKYTPEIAPYIAEAAPELVRQSSEAMQGRSAQRKALEKYLLMGETGDDAISAQESFMARQRAGADTRSRQQALEQNFARRGQLGSGMQFAAQLQAGQAAGNQQALAQMQAASDAQRRRLEALARGADVGASIYSQEMDLASQNTDIINRFNQRMANSRQAYEMSRMGALNDAQRYNLGMQQDIANANVRQRNRAQEMNQDRADSLTKYGAEFARGERNRMDDIERERYRNTFNERGYQNEIAQRKADWAANQRRLANDIRSQQFNDQMRWSGAMSGQFQNEREAARERDRDRATQVQGAANIGSTMYERDAARQDWAAGQAAEDARWGGLSDEERKRRRDDYYGGY